MGVDDDLQLLCMDLNIKLVVCGTSEESLEIIKSLALLKNKQPVKDMSIETKEELAMLKGVHFDYIDESDLDYLFFKYQVVLV